MIKLDEEKLKEEIKGLRTSRIYNIFKGIALLFGSIALFVIIQMPESVLNKQASQETINRERARLILDVIHNNNDFENIVLELSVIQKAYPESDTIWLSEIRNIYITKLDKKNNYNILNSIDTAKNKRIFILRKELNELYEKKEKYQTELIMEANGTGGTGKLGLGPAYKMIKMQIDKLNKEILKREKELDGLKNKIQ